MRVIHVPYSFFPDRVGGTEVYVLQLARALSRLDIVSVIAAPGNRDDKYVHESIVVHRFATHEGADHIQDLYGRGDATAERGFARVLRNAEPDLVHFHAFSPAVSTRLVRLTRELGIARLFTYHTPAVSCPRQSLMRWGDTVCDGKLRLRTCSACRLHSLGIPRPAALPLALVPASLGRRVTETDHHSRVHTAMGMSALISRRHAAVREYIDGMDRIVTLSRWSRKLLLVNGISDARVVLSPHGIENVPAISRSTPPRRTDGAIRLVLIARADPVKGVHTVLKALQDAPEIPIRLALVLRVQPGQGEHYAEYIRSLAAGDTRITCLWNQDSPDRDEQLSRAHAVVVPSECLETGPLIVLEAFARGLPILGSRLGGIAELVDHGNNGLLVDPCSVGAWTQTLRRATENGVLERLRDGVKAPRTMDEVAVDMKALYEDVLDDVIQATPPSP